MGKWKDGFTTQASGWSAERSSGRQEKSLLPRKEKKALSRNRGRRAKEPAGILPGGLCLSACLAAALAWLFFRSAYGLFLTFPAAVIYYGSCREKERQKKLTQRRSQCKDGFLAVASAVSAGYALENAVISAKQELKELWGADSYIVEQWAVMERQMEMRMPVEKVIAGFAERSRLEEVQQLAELIGIAKRSGGRIGDILRSAAGQMQEKLTVEMEIQTQITEKKLELQIMLLVPPGILLYLMTFSYETVAPLYTTLWGRGFMAACLAVYGAGWWIGQRILRIEV